MGLLEALLGKENPLAQWAGENSNYLGALGGGLASGPTFSRGIANGLSMAPQAKMLDMQAAEARQEKAKEEQQVNATRALLGKEAPDLAQLLDTGIPMGEVWGEYLRRKQPGQASKPIEINGQLVDPNTFEVLGDFRTVEGKGGNAEVALQPTWMQDGQGNWVIGQLAKDGRLVQTELPPGMRAANPGAISGDRTSGTVDAKTAGAARAALPGATVQRDVTLAAIDRVTQDEAGLNEWFGQWGALPRGMAVQGGSKMGNWVANFSQAEGQSFLQARQFLKGQGAITELESAKAEQAYSRMAAAKQIGDKQTFLQAAADFKAAVEEGYRKLEATAAGAYSAPQPGSAPPAASGGNVTSTGVPWSIEP